MSKSASMLVIIALATFSLVAQSLEAQSTQPKPPVPQWQISAGGKMAFDVASVRRNKSGDVKTHSNVNLAPDDAFTPTGGLFAGTNLALLNYMVFAYKITGSQVQLLRPQLPNWANTDRFDIQARAEGNPTKDQLRLMMQSLLANRFNLVIHYETRQLPVFGLVLEKPGKTGPQLQPHSVDPKCPGLGTTSPRPAPPSKPGDKFPLACGYVTIMPASAPGLVRLAARNLSAAEIENTVGGYGAYGGIDRPILGQTGLNGYFDFSLEWMPLQPNGPPNPQADPEGPTFLEALRDQLGLKLVPQTGPVDVLVLDHVEEPSPN